ncbi:MAG TPA: tetratricopeptide repeat protein [Blastocatellia bacterium]|nr:tetratricopeptide repeat protein [Blastocatellia bacterium]
MRKDLLTAGAIIALTLIFAPAARSQEVKTAQETKPAQASDNRAQALKKYLEAQRLEQSGNFPGAVAAYKEAITLDPQSAELRVAFGSLYLKSRNVIDAEAQAREAMKVAPDNPEVRKLLARVYLAQTFVGTTLDKEKARAAIKELEEVARLNASAKIEIGSQEVAVYTLIGELYWSLDEEDKALDALKRVAESDGAADKAHFQLAQLYYQKNKFREAATAARKAYDLNQKSSEYAGLLAKSLLRIGRTQEALDIYKKAIGVKDAATDKDDPDEPGKEALPFSPLLFDYADALVSAGRYDEATKVIEPVLKIVRKDSSAYLNLVRINVDALRRSGKRDDAVRTLEEALKGQDVSESLPILYALAETYEEMLKFDKAVETYEEALTAIVNPDGTVSGQQNKQNAGLMLRRIAAAHRMAGKREKALETFERIRKLLGPEDTLADRLMIDALMNEGKNKEALDAATSAMKRFPDERTFKLFQAQAAGKLGDLATAEATLKTLLKDGPEDADIYLFWSSVQLEANQLKQAEETVRKAILIDPNDIGPLITLSIIQERQNKFKDSEATLRRALEIDPDNATVLNNLGYFLADRSERIPEAETLIRRAVNIEPTNGSYLDSLGWVLFRQGKVQEAQKYLEMAAMYSPRSATIHDHLGDLYKKQGQTDKARAKWEEALRLATEPEEIKKIKEKLGKK